MAVDCAFLPCVSVPCVCACSSERTPTGLYRSPSGTPGGGIATRGSSRAGSSSRCSTGDEAGDFSESDADDGYDSSGASSDDGASVPVPVQQVGSAYYGGVARHRQSGDFDRDDEEGDDDEPVYEDEVVQQYGEEGGQYDESEYQQQYGEEGVEQGDGSDGQYNDGYYDEHGAEQPYDEHGAEQSYDEHGAHQAYDEHGAHQAYDEHGYEHGAEQQYPDQYDEHGYPVGPSGAAQYTDAVVDSTAHAHASVDDRMSSPYSYVPGHDSDVHYYAADSAVAGHDYPRGSHHVDAAAVDVRHRELRGQEYNDDDDDDIIAAPSRLFADVRGAVGRLPSSHHSVAGPPAPPPPPPSPPPQQQYPQLQQQFVSPSGSAHVHDAVPSIATSTTSPGVAGGSGRSSNSSGGTGKANRTLFSAAHAQSESPRGRTDGLTAHRSWLREGGDGTHSTPTTAATTPVPQPHSAPLATASTGGITRGKSAGALSSSSSSSTAAGTSAAAMLLNRHSGGHVSTSSPTRRSLRTSTSLGSSSSSLLGSTGGQSASITVVASKQQFQQQAAAAMQQQQHPQRPVSAGSHGLMGLAVLSPASLSMSPPQASTPVTGVASRASPSSSSTTAAAAAAAGSARQRNNGFAASSFLESSMSTSQQQQQQQQRAGASPGLALRSPPSGACCQLHGKCGTGAGGIMQSSITSLVTW